MSLSDEERNTIVRLEIEKSKNTFAEVIALVNAGLWSGAANRLYYAVFHAVSALLVHDRHQVNTHQGSHALFGLHYIKTGILEEQFSDTFTLLQTMREKSDYNCSFDATQELIEPLFAPTKKMIDAVSERVIA